MVRAYILINTRVGKIWDVVNAVKRLEGIKIIDAVSGPYDVIAVFELENIEKLVGIIKQLHSIEGIERTLTCIALT